MPPRKRAKPIQASTSTRRTRGAQDVRNNSHSRAVNSDNAVEYDGRTTRFRASRLRTNVSSLPLEVLGEIFILTLPTSLESHRRLVPTDHSPRITNPLVLCAVCSSWRSLAFSMPQLWERVHIHFSYSLKNAQAKKKAALLVQWIERSCPLPLTLYISRDIKYGVEQSLSETGPEAAILSVLNEYAVRWESIYCRTPFALDARWNTLQLIYLHSPCLALSAAENHTSPWAQLTHLQIQFSISYRDADTIFTKCPELVRLSISVYPTDDITTVTAPKTMHNLVTFSLRLHFSKLQKIVHQLSLPSLREFSIEYISSDDIEPLSNLFTRSHCVLDVLEIHGIWTFALGGIISHRSCNSLNSLIINSARHGYSPADGDELLRRLTLHRNDTLCTQLKSLEINYSIPTSSSSTLLSMIESRICSRDESMLEYLQLRLEKKFAELDKVGRGSGLNYSCTRPVPRYSLVRFQRPGFGKPPNLGELIYEI